MNRLWVSFILVLLLSGCAGAVSRGATVYDKVLDAAIFTKCKAASVGSIDRRYMQTSEGWELWYRECRGTGNLAAPMLPEGLDDE